jgi:acyl-CoA reductase-like NAD-dependent aldehyde dehydrogenase/ABC-type branched-subunit amino acid transport system ATPase component
MLEVARLSVSYGKHEALSGVELKIARGEIVAMLGANGAGKTTLLKAIAGLVQPWPGGRITLDGRNLAGLPPHAIVERGVALVPEGRGIFGELTVRENLLLGAYAERARAREQANLALVLGLFPRLQERIRQTVRTMSGGEQQMVAIARALMSSPDILLLDEPSLGLSPLLCGELFQNLTRIRDAGIGILLVEQNVRQSLTIADRGYLLETGRIVGHGEAAALKCDPAVLRAYLGAGDVRGDIPEVVAEEAALQPEAVVLALAAAPPAAPGGGVNEFGAEPLPERSDPPHLVEPRRAARPRNEKKEKAMLHVNLMIGDREMSAADGRTFERVDPLTGEIATRAAAATVADATAAADAAAAAFPAWAALGPSERRARLLAAADTLESRAEDFAESMITETGATAPWAGFNVHLAAGMLREAASMTTQITGETIPTDKPGSFAMSLRQPAGVVLGIAPWNAPVILGVRAIAMPLACGNTVVLKASELCPATHRLIGTALRDSGIPHGVVNVVTNAPADAPKVVETLIAHPAVRRINFTGSTRVGRIVAETAARYLKPVLLELGGKAPLVVLDDADLDEAVKAAAFGAFANQGQICMSTERIVVDDKVADVFVEKLAAKAKSLPAGDPRGGDVVLGSMINKDAVACVRELVDDAVAKGATLVAGGEINGTVMTATVLDHVNPSMRIYGEESFGPVTTVVRARDTEHAIHVANDTEYGLSAAVFGRDIARALDVAKRIQSGMCHINGPTVHDEAQMPFGGTKSSGYGRFGGKAAIDEFTELRWITIQTGPHPYPF